MDCFSYHIGLWAADAKWLSTMVSEYNAGRLERVSMPEPQYTIVGDGVAVVPIHGGITKGQSSFGGTSSLATRQLLRKAYTDKDVRGILLDIDSPGGAVSGLKPLSDEVYKIRNDATKPIHAYTSDMMASAAYWVGSQASRVTAYEMAEIGSIGTYAVVSDTSQAYADAGVKVHVVGTGEMKGAFVPGTEVTDDMIAELRERVAQINEFFLSSVQRGRGMARKDVTAVADGRDWLAKDALSRGLIDGIGQFEDAVRAVERDAKALRAGSRSLGRRAAVAELE